MRSARPCLLACGLLVQAAGCASGPRFAGVEGRPVPCSGALARPPTPAPGVDVAVACVHYEVEGETAEALARSMDERGPRDERGAYHGYTLFDLSYGYDERREPGACGATSIVVQLRLVHVLPARRRPARLDPELSARWGRFVERLAVHESGHGGRDVRAAIELLGGLGGLAPEPSCEALRARAHGVFERVLRELRRENRLYDVRTGHGAAQGARFP